MKPVQGFLRIISLLPNMLVNDLDWRGNWIKELLTPVKLPFLDTTELERQPT